MKNNEGVFIFVIFLLAVTFVLLLALAVLALCFAPSFERWLLGPLTSYDGEVVATIGKFGL